MIDGGPSVFDGGPSVGSRNPKAGQRIAGTERKKRKGKEKKAVDAPTRYESEVLQALQEIPKFRRDETKNLAMIRDLAGKFKYVDQRAVAGKLARGIKYGEYTTQRPVMSFMNWVSGAAKRNIDQLETPERSLTSQLEGLNRALEQERITRDRYEREKAALYAAAGVTK